MRTDRSKWARDPSLALRKGESRCHNRRRGQRTFLSKHSAHKQKRATRRLPASKIQNADLVNLLLHRGELQLGLRQRLYNEHLSGFRRQVARRRHFAHQEILGTFEHFLFAEGEGLAATEGDEALEDYGHLEERTRAHALGVLLESMFPVVVRVEFSLFEKTQYLRRVVGTYYRSEANRERIR